MQYFGVIVDTMDRDVDLIEGDYPYKPSLENAGWFCTCKWFKTKQEQLNFAEYSLRVFIGMMRKEISSIHGMV